MAGSGPPPKDPSKRQRQNRSEQTDLAGGPASAPDMPEGDWHSRAVMWWDRWTTAPQAGEFAVTDWQRLEMLLPLVSDYWSEPDTKLLAEIRLNEERLGATAIDRKRLGWRLSQAEAEPDKKRKSSRSRKDPRREHLKAV